MEYLYCLHEILQVFFFYEVSFQTFIHDIREKVFVRELYVILYHTISYCNRNFSVLFVSFENVKIFHFIDIKSAENFSLSCAILKICLMFHNLFFFVKILNFSRYHARYFSSSLIFDIIHLFANSKMIFERTNAIYYFAKFHN